MKKSENNYRVLTHVKVQADERQRLSLEACLVQWPEVDAVRWVPEEQTFALLITVKDETAFNKFLAENIKSLPGIGKVENLPIMRREGWRDRVNRMLDLFRSVEKLKIE